jgi:hypothetical protein
MEVAFCFLFGFTDCNACMFNAYMFKVSFFKFQFLDLSLERPILWNLFQNYWHLPLKEAMQEWVVLESYSPLTSQQDFFQIRLRFVLKSTVSLPLVFRLVGSLPLVYPLHYILKHSPIGLWGHKLIYTVLLFSNLYSFSSFGSFNGSFEPFINITSNLSNLYNYEDILRKTFVVKLLKYILGNSVNTR